MGWKTPKHQKSFQPVFLSNMAKKSNSIIPGLSFSWKRALGITQAKQKIAREIGIPTTSSGLERKIGKTVLKLLFGKHS